MVVDFEAFHKLLSIFLNEILDAGSIIKKYYLVFLKYPFVNL